MSSWLRITEVFSVNFFSNAYANLLGFFFLITKKINLVIRPIHLH
jgi:hypothetical protein